MSLALPFPAPAPAPDRRPAAAAPRVFIIHPDPDFAAALRHALELDGRAVELVRERRPAPLPAARVGPTLLILGLEHLTAGAPDLFQSLRRDHPGTAVLVIAGRPLPAHHLPGFRLGFDDFVVRPVPVRELHTRIDGMLARAGAGDPSPRCAGGTLRFGSVEVDPRARRVWREGRPVALRPREYELLLILARREGEAVSRAELLREVWGYSEAAVTRTVDSHVVQLRRKLEREPTRPAHIVTVPTVGYRLDAGPAPPGPSGG